MRPGSMAIPHRPTNLGLDLTPPRKQHVPLETKTDYGKYRYDQTTSIRRITYEWQMPLLTRFEFSFLLLA